VSVPTAPDRFVALMRRYVVDYTNRHDTSVCADLMEPDYTLRMGRHFVTGRDDAYVPAAQKQFAQFPGLGLTVHEIVTNGTRLAMRFSEHGASVRHGGAVASWSGIGLYRWNGRRLVENLVEQDYQARRRQLAGGPPDPVAPPAPAPWDAVAVPAERRVEHVVREWIDAGLPGDAVITDDGDSAALIENGVTHVDDMFSAGAAVAFRLTRTGPYSGGLDGVDPAAVGAQATLHLVALVHVVNGLVASGHIVRDRLGMARSLAPAGSTSGR
jgi:predicted ester cyclase